MPILSYFGKNGNLVSQGARYEILFSHKRDHSKQIFRAFRKDEKTGVKQEVLLKIFLKEPQDFREEFESLSQVVSPYCVRLFGFENFADKKALILEYVRGVNLFQLIEAFSLNEREIHHILSSIYRGLKDLSRQGFCHGDLSLNNVLLDERAHIKLIDFGKANYERDIQGTPPFTAPEVLQGARANFLSDLFSLGVIEALLKSPGPLNSLSEMKPGDFDSFSPLLSLDPKKRFFPDSEKHKPEEGLCLNSLIYKVKELLAVTEFRRRSTVKKPRKKPLSSFLLLKTALFVLTFSSITSSQTLWPVPGMVKIYTDKWFLIRVGNFESYTPLSFPLKPGRHFIQWKSSFGKGSKKVFISQGKTLILSDKDFLSGENRWGFFSSSQAGDKALLSKEE